MKTTITVSMVEDKEEILNRVKIIIEEADDFLFLSAYSNAEDALQELPVLQPRIVLMDINLPGMSGIECIRKIKRKYPEIQFMMFTIYEDSEQVFEALEAGASGYLLKKMSFHKIPEALKELYQGGAPMSAQIARKVVHSFRKADPEDNTGGLSAREKEVVHLLARGFLYKEIGDKLHIATGTVKQHIHKIYEKLHVQNRTEALNKYYGKKDKPQ